MAINPYRFFPIYTDEMVKLYTNKRREELAPHVFAVADEAYRNLLADRESQSMLVTYALTPPSLLTALRPSLCASLLAP